MLTRGLLVVMLTVPPSTRLAAQSGTAEPLVRALDSPQTAWAATARIRTAPDEIVRALLASRAPLERPHGGLAPRGLALAKRGPSVIPAIEARLRGLRGATDMDSRVDAFGLIEVLATFRGLGVPALVDVAEQTVDSSVRRSALNALVRMDPEAHAFDRIGNPWTTWHPAGGDTWQTSSALAEAVPRLEGLLRRQPQRADDYPWTREAAYLLAKWGTGEARANGLGALTSIAAETGGDGDWMAAVWLWRLRSPAANTILDAFAANARPGDLRDQMWLRVAVMLQHAGDPRAARWFEQALESTDPRTRADALDAIRSGGAVAMIAALIARLDDPTPSGRTHATYIDGRLAHPRATLGDLALDALRGLTFQELPADRAAWETWLATHSPTSRSEWLRAWVAARAPRVGTATPVEAWLWLQSIADLPVTDVLPLIDAYLGRPETSGGSTGVGGGIGFGGRSLFNGESSPPVVTLLLRGTHAAVPGFRERLVRSLEASDPKVRLHAALAVAAFDRPRATGALARQAADPSLPYTRYDASRFLLFLGDPRGIPGLLDEIGRDGDQRMAGPERLRACEHLRWFTQQTIPCRVGQSATDWAADVQAWRHWWTSDQHRFVVLLREALLDDEARFHVPAVRRGTGPPVE